MALINCPECGNSVSDKAPNCPRCGVTIFVPDKEVLCCPKCKSIDVDSFQKGFSGKKAFVGAALTGGIGLLAGTVGSKKIMLGCKKCGNKFPAGEAIVKKIGTNAEKYEKEIKERNENEKTARKFLSEGKKNEAIKFYMERYNITEEDAILKINYLTNKIKKEAEDNEKKTTNGIINCSIIVIAFFFMFVLIVKACS